MARVPLPVDTYRRLNEQEPKWHIKAILRILGTLVAIIAVILFAVSVSYTNQNFINTTGAGDWTDGLAIAPVSHHQLEPIMKNAIQKKNPQKDRPPTEHDVRSTTLSTILNPVLLLTHLICRRGSSLHPALPLTLDLLIVMLCIPSLVFAVAGGLFWYWTPAILSTSGTVDCGFFFNEWSRECHPVAYTIGHMEIAGIVFLFLVFVTHAILLTFAGIDMHKYRKASTLSKFADDTFTMEEQQSYRHRDAEDHHPAGPPAYSSDGSLKEESRVAETEAVKFT
ncbi:hypothetical protein MMC06_006588 [Schaereria dolodes]|nr:hypothetical protein [Schaereria dolodes]